MFELVQGDILPGSIFIAKHRLAQATDSFGAQQLATENKCACFADVWQRRRCARQCKAYG